MYQSISNSLPTANIAVNRNRVKHYDKHVYLKDGTHFEIELFNPLWHKVMAKISIDGVSISSSGIVIKPGQRVFLERWIDTPKKFLFETYQIEDSAEAKAAAQQNGVVKVQFFNENVSFTALNHVTNYWGGLARDRQFLMDGPSGLNGPSGPHGISGFTTTSVYAANVSYQAGSLETGRTEMGASSNQNFSQDNGSYSGYIAVTEILQILPEGLKPVEVSDIRNYCSECGTRIKKTAWKFCPSCGTQI